MHAHGLCQAHGKQERVKGELSPIRTERSHRPKDGKGYALVYVPGHSTAYGNGWAKEHRYFMAEKLGRSLFPNENVHHINGIRDDNRLENLELWIVGQPKGQRVEDVLAWARDVVAQYEG